MGKPKNINVLLLDGTVDGRIKYSMSNWVGSVWRFPSYSDLKNFLEPGIVFMIKGDKIVIDFVENASAEYDEYIVIETENNTANAYYLIELLSVEILKASNYRVSSPYKAVPTELSLEQRVVVENYADICKIIIDIINIDIFHSSSCEKSQISLADTTPKLVDRQYYRCVRRDSNAFGYWEDQHTFVLVKFSRLCPSFAISCPKYVKRKRGEYYDKCRNNILGEDICFNSISGASSFVVACSSNGNVDFKPISSDEYTKNIMRLEKEYQDLG